MQQQSQDPEALLASPFQQQSSESSNRDDWSESKRNGQNTTLSVVENLPGTAPQGSLTGRRKRQRSPTTSSQMTGENTFHQKMQIRVRHSVGSMSISPSSRDIVLAGRQGLLIIDLENPWLPPRILPHMSKWEVADVQWSPYLARESWIASTSNQKALIWNLNYSGPEAIEHILHAHSRAISDINWSLHDPNMLATCSVDTYVHMWDVRIIGQEAHSGKEGIAIGSRDIRPESSFCAWTAGATQVKFNRKNQYLLASAHDKNVIIWDIRKGSVPVTTINAHSTKIYGIDWSRQNGTDIVTCGLDKTVKFWDINDPDTAQTTIITNSPVWRARNTPFGSGVLMMPQRTETTLFLYNRNTPKEPVYAFEGHADNVKEFVWRWRGDPDHADKREFQLVTWSKDQNLRLWPITTELMSLVGDKDGDSQTHPTITSQNMELDGTYRPHSFQRPPAQNIESGMKSPGAALMRVMGSTRTSTGFSPLKPAIPGTSGIDTTTGREGVRDIYRDQKYAIPPLLWMQNVKTVRPTGELHKDGATEDTFQNVAEEMSIILNKFSSAGVRTERVNAASRTCTITLHGPWSDTGSAFLRITINFPPQYPDNTPPEFEIQKNSMISIFYRAHMAQDLNTLASAYTAQKRYCLEPCLRYLLGEAPAEELTHLRFGVGNAHGFSPFAPKGSNGSAGTANDASGFGNWNTSPGVNNADSDDEMYVGSSFASDFGFQGKRVSMQSEKGIIVDMSVKQSVDQNVPFPRLCGATFSGNGTLVTFFSTLRVRNSERSSTTAEKSKSSTNLTSGNNNNSFITNNYSEFYHHPKTYEQFEEYKEIAAMSRQGRNATVLASGNSGAFGDYTYDDGEDDMDEGVVHNTASSLYLRPENLEMGNSLNNDESILYPSAKAHHETYHVTLHNLGDVLPFNADLARAYIVSGEDPLAICSHNAMACKSLGYLELYKVWCLAGEILRECVPIANPSYLDYINNKPGRARSTDVTQNQMHKYAHDLKLNPSIPPLKHPWERRDSGTGLPSSDISVVQRRHMERITWGVHPLGRQLVDKLMLHFVNKGDVQTLAMLSCVFREPFYNEKVSNNIVPTLTQSEVPQITPMPASSSSADYFSFRNRHESLQSGMFTAVTPYQHLRNNRTSSESYNSEKDFLAQLPFAVDPTPTPFGLGITHNNGATDSYVAALDAAKHSSSFKLSVPQRLPTNTAPTVRNNNDDGFLSMLPFISYSWGSTTTAIPVTPDTPRGHAPMLNSSVNLARDGHVTPQEITIEMTNTEAFDDDRLFRHQIPLLDASKLNEMNAFRIFYADMLYRLGLFEKRAEVLKFVGQDFTQGDNLNGGNSSQVNNHVHALLGTNDSPHLEIKVRCRQCHNELIYAEATPSWSNVNSQNGGYCSTCQRTRHRITCSICHTLVRGLVNFCIRCGHGGHSAHIKEWFVDYKRDVCPTGCGCQCLFETLEYGVPEVLPPNDTVDKTRS